MPYIRCLEYLRVNFDNKLTPEEKLQWKNDIEKIKENDPTKINKNGVVDLDHFLVKMIQKYRILLKRTK